jgi:hypothetical protein
MVVSTACAVHCLGLGIAIALMPSLGSRIGFLEGLEWGFFSAALGLGGLSLLPGYVRHRSARPLGLFAVGIGLVGVARFSGIEGGAETIGSVLGALFIVGAHARNAREGCC